MKAIIGAPGAIKGFIASIFKEISLVEFPSSRDTLNMTAKVLLVVTISTIILLALDIAFNELRQLIISVN